MAEVNPPFALQTVSIQHGAKLFRRALGAAFSPGVSTFNTNGDLTVRENSSPSMHVKVQRGGAYVKGTDTTDQGIYFVYNDGEVTKAIAAADPTNPRIDLVGVRVKDLTEGVAGDTWEIVVVTGTPAASPSPPSTPSSTYVLAHVAVAAGATQIVNANITDQRTYIQVAGQQTFRGVRAYRTSTQSIPNASYTAVQFTSEEFDTDTFHDNSSNNSRFTVPSGMGGYYAIDAGVEWSNNTTNRRLAKLIKNNSVDLATDSDYGAAQSATAEIRQTLSAGVKLLTAGDYVELQVWHNITGGGSLTITGGAGLTWMSMYKVG